MSERKFQARWLGRCPYDRALALQTSLCEQRKADLPGEGIDTLLLLEHDPVLTIGRGGDHANVLLSSEELAQRGVALYESSRGGDVTYHGPGQLVAYPIFNLRPERCDVRKYVRSLVDVMTLLCADYGVGAGPSASMIGAWVDLSQHTAEWPGDDKAISPAKIGAIGVKISRWVTMHGFALNVHTQLEDFSMIVPCGLREKAVCSLASVTGAPLPGLAWFARRAVCHFETVFNAECVDGP